VGGDEASGQVFHFDGTAWSPIAIPSAPLLAWVFGFSATDIHVVGVDGVILHYDGADWTTIESSTTQDLWGVWGSSPDDVWIVGGSVDIDGEAVILHYDGERVQSVAVPDNDRNATALFKVWGIGDRAFAVGQNGLILQLTGDDWVQVPAGPDADDDFVALWGTSVDRIVAVGGRSTARIAVYDGTQWNTSKPSGVPGLNAISMIDPNEAVVGGVNGFVGTFDPDTEELVAESAGTNLTIHGAWADGAGRHYGVGGLFSPPYLGLALVRTVEVIE
jgi:hypothetical protein